MILYSSSSEKGQKQRIIKKFVTTVLLKLSWGKYNAGRKGKSGLWKTSLVFGQNCNLRTTIVLSQYLSDEQCQN